MSIPAKTVTVLNGQLFAYLVQDPVDFDSVDLLKDLGYASDDVGRVQQLLEQHHLNGTLCPGPAIDHAGGTFYRMRGPFPSKEHVPFLVET